MFGSDDSDDDSDEKFELGVMVNGLSVANKEILLSKRSKSAGMLIFKTGTEEALLIYVARQLSSIRKINEWGEGEEDIKIADLVLRIVDVYCYSRAWMMHLSDVKMPILIDCIKKARGIQMDAGKLPLICVELGSYCGYSTVAIGKELIDGEQLFAVEMNTKAVEYTKRLLNLAEISDSLVKCLNVSSSESINLLKSHGISEGSIGLLFLDHEKTLYPNDIEIFIQSGLLASGCVVVADNICFSGCLHSRYLDIVRKKNDEGGYFKESEFFESFVEYTTHDPDMLDQPIDITDGMEVSLFNR